MADPKNFYLEFAENFRTVFILSSCQSMDNSVLVNMDFVKNILLVQRLMMLEHTCTWFSIRYFFDKSGHMPRGFSQKSLKTFTGECVVDLL